MAIRKVTIAMGEKLASAAERELRLSFGRRLLAEWQDEHGAFTPEERAAARAEIAAADLEFVQGRQSTGPA